MTWEIALAELFDDLETDAQGQALAARAEDVVDLARAEYAEVGLESRLSGSVGELVSLELPGTSVRGRLVRVGRGCLVVVREAPPTRHVLVNLDHLISLRTPSSRATPEQMRPLSAQLGLASALRHLVAEDERVTVRLVDGHVTTGDCVRVGADFVALAGTAGSHGQTALVPMSVLVTVEPA